MLEVLDKYESVWLPVLLLIEIGLTLIGLRFQKIEVDWARREFEYDEARDLEKKQRRTRTTKKTTTDKTGLTTTEEVNETFEPADEKRDKL